MKRDWDIVTSYIDNVGTSNKTVSFPKPQDSVRVTNKGNTNLIYTIGTKSGTLAPSGSVTVNETVTSFTVRAATGKAEYEVRASEAGTEKEEAATDVMSLLAEKATDLEQRGVNVKNFGAKGDGITDDSQAVKAAIAHAVAMRKLHTTATAFYGFVPKIYFPAGIYLIKEKRALEPITGSDTLRGFRFSGDSFENTRIVFDSNIADTDNYLIYNYNRFSYSTIENIHFVAKNGVEKLYYSYSAPSSGRVQSIRWVNCKYENFAESIKIDGTTDMSENVWTNCKVTSVPANGVFLYSATNPQAVDFNFFGCDIEGISGTAFKFEAGGNLNVWGGSMITLGSGLFFSASDYGGSLIGTNNNTFNFTGVRTEIRDDSRLFYFKSTGKLSFIDSQLAIGTTGKETQSKGTLDQKGTVVFRGCTISNHVFTALTNDNSYALSDNPLYLVKDCMLGSQPSTMFVTTHTGNNTGGITKVIVDGCRNIVNVAEPVDVVLNKVKGYTSNTYPTKTITFRVDPVYNNGLGNNATYSFKLPIGAIIKKVRIIHINSTGTTGTYAYTVTNHDGSVTFANMPTVDALQDLVANSSDLWYEITTETTRTIKLVSAGATPTTIQRGYIVVEYF